MASIYSPKGLLPGSPFATLTRLGEWSIFTHNSAGIVKKEKVFILNKK
jgi:hypothetical protein